MKTAIIAVVGLAAAANADLIISEIVDATLPSGLPKFVEITNTGNSSVDLSNFSLGNANNGAASLGFDALVLSGSLAAGDSYVVSFENSDAPGSSTFFDVYGFDADNLEQGAFFNGDDVIALFSGAALAGDTVTGANVVDVYGVIGVDGSGESWEYTDGYSFRNASILSGTGAAFGEAGWTIGGANSLETGDDVEELALILANTTPGSHNFVPTPGAAAAFGLAGLAAARRRR